MDNCKCITTIEASSIDGENVSLTIISDCKSVEKLGEELKEVNVFKLGRNIGDSEIYKTASKCLRHLACLVPAVVIRTVEVETGMALPGKSYISVKKE